LRAGETDLAESRYRAALLEGLLLLGAVHAADDDLERARAAFERASRAAVETRRALTSLALVDLQRGKPEEAVAVLSRMAVQSPKDIGTRRLLAQALVALGKPEQAVQELVEARGLAPDDPELAFTLATGYLRLKKVDAADRLFQEVLAKRPMPETYVLIGRMYRDFEEFEKARVALETALQKNPRIRRAHDYLGTMAVISEGPVKLAEAIEHFRQELRLAPDDPLANLHLGMSLVTARRPAEALPALQIATRARDARPEAFQYLGRCLLALDRPAEAIAPLERALKMVTRPGARESQLSSLHYELARALKATGSPDADRHFAEARGYAEKLAETSRDRLSNYLSGDADPQARFVTTSMPLDLGGLDDLTTAERKTLETRAMDSLTRAYFNLGVMKSQAAEHRRAAELFTEAATLQPAFPQVQYSLGVSRFSAGQFREAIAPLSEALAATPSDLNVKRMLALASFNSEDFAKAADLLAGDPEREKNPSLQYTYSVALVRGGRAAEAEKAIAQLVAAHGNTPEVNVVLGHAYAEQGDFESAEKTLKQALAAKPDVADANTTLGLMFLKQGRLAEAETSLRAELAARPADVRARHTLALVLDMQRKPPEEAVKLLRGVLSTQPDHANARYLLGKMLLAQGFAEEAVVQLEAAVKLDPNDPNALFQLAQAYQKLGRADLAERHFARYREIKDKRRGGGA
jgi:tetratricopeptide (TPR) repeat protein